MRSRSLRAHALLALLATALVGGCAPVTPPPSSPAQPVAVPTTEAVTIGFAVPQHLVAFFGGLAERFNAEQPDVRVQVVPVDSGAMTGDDSLRAAVELGDAAIVGTWLVQVHPEPDGLLRDLGPLIDADPAFERDDLYPDALVEGSQPGRILALQQSVAPPLLSFNRDLFAAAGVAEPAAGWGWAEIFAAAERLARPDEPAPTYGLMGAQGDFVTVAIYDPHGQVVERRVVMLGDRVVSGQHRPERSGAPFSADELLALARSLNFESGD